MIYEQYICYKCALLFVESIFSSHNIVSGAKAIFGADVVD